MAGMDVKGEIPQEFAGAEETPGQINGLKTAVVGENVSGKIQIETTKSDTYLTQSDLEMAKQFVEAEQKLDKAKIQGVKAKEAIKAIENDISQKLGKNIGEIFTGDNKKDFSG